MPSVVEAESPVCHVVEKVIVADFNSGRGPRGGAGGEFVHAEYGRVFEELPDVHGGDYIREESGIEVRITSFRGFSDSFIDVTQDAMGVGDLKERLRKYKNVKQTRNVDKLMV